MSSPFVEMTCCWFDHRSQSAKLLAANVKILKINVEYSLTAGQPIHFFLIENKIFISELTGNN